MRFRRWRAALGAVVVATGVATAGLVAVNSASADPIEDGGVAKIATPAVDGVSYCVIPTGELRECLTWPERATEYTFVATTCRNPLLLCYEIRTSFGQCLYYDVELSKIGQRTCDSISLTYRWHVDELNNAGRIRLRPASHTTRCVVYDPGRLPEYPYTSIKPCSFRPASHSWFRLLHA